MSNKIHPSSVLDGDITLGDHVEIGPYCHLQGKIKIGSGTHLEGHVSLGYRHGILEIGENNQFSPGAAIGGPPQDVSYKNEPTRLKIGSHNIFREFSTVNLSTTKADLETTIGDHNYFMSYTHVGHDCKIGNHVVIANNSHLGGHSIIEDHVTIGGVCAFNQFTRVGKYSFIAGGSIVNKDILPYSRAYGNHAVCRATNKVGLLRKGFSPEHVESIHRAIRIFLLGSETAEGAITRIQRECLPSQHLDYFVQFIRESQRGIAK